MSSRSSSSVSKPASAARSSSSSGSSLALTSLTVTANSASWPASSFAGYSSGKVTVTVRSSPAAAPSSCSSKPPTSRPEPSSTIWSRPSPPANGLAVERAAVVHDDEVARRGGPLDGVEPGRALAQAVELLADRLVGDVGLAAADLEPLVLAQLGLRADADLDREGQRLALLRQVAHVELRLADGHDVRRVDRRRVPGADRVAHRLVEDGLAAHPLDDHRRRRLAGPEARDPQALPEALGGLGDAALDLLRRHLGLHAHA